VLASTSFSFSTSSAIKSELSACPPTNSRFLRYQRRGNVRMLPACSPMSRSCLYCPTCVCSGQGRARGDITATVSLPASVMKDNSRLKPKTASLGQRISDSFALADTGHLSLKLLGTNSSRSGCHRFRPRVPICQHRGCWSGSNLPRCVRPRLSKRLGRNGFSCVCRPPSHTKIVTEVASSCACKQLRFLQSSRLG
jgi:hypothetical protein